MGHTPLQVPEKERDLGVVVSAGRLLHDLHARLWILNLSSRVQLDIKLNTPYRVTAYRGGTLGSTQYRITTRTKIGNRTEIPCRKSTKYQYRI